MLAVLALTACGSATPAARQGLSTTPVAMASPSSASPFASAGVGTKPSPSVSPSAVTPARTAPKPVVFSCSSTIPIGAQLALVSLSGSTDIVVRDLTDMSHPVSRCTFKTCIQSCVSFGPRDMSFVDGSHISYTANDGNGGYAIYVANL